MVIALSYASFFHKFLQQNKLTVWKDKKRNESPKEESRKVFIIIENITVFKIIPSHCFQ